MVNGQGPMTCLQFSILFVHFTFGHNGTRKKKYLMRKVYLLKYGTNPRKSLF